MGNHCSAASAPLEVYDRPVPTVLGSDKSEVYAFRCVNQFSQCFRSPRCQNRLLQEQIQIVKVKKGIIFQDIRYDPRRIQSVLFSTDGLAPQHSLVS
jgi:hypothetical protein